jgi:hypothetical protein
MGRQIDRLGRDVALGAGKGGEFEGRSLYAEFVIITIEHGVS